ncbi:MAG: hypothetical protein KAS07_04835 [Candidatus Pacebacteria bacterium]|nr:hypothetical protein [Candidatus Paceibacterota bacterium]
MDDNTKLQILHEHYNDTFSIIKKSIKLRDKLTAFVLFVLTLVVLYAFWPNDAVNTLSQLATQEFGISVTLDTSFFGSVIWFALLIVVVRYTQTVVYIERQYAYIHQIEENLHQNFKDSVAFTREGKSYLKKYPTYSNWVCLLYTVVFPIIIITITLAKIINEWSIIYQANIFSLLINTSIAICIFISIFLYMIFMHKQN